MRAPPPAPPMPRRHHYTPDRSIRLRPGQLVRTAYVPVFDCVLANRERMAVGDVDGAYQKLLQLGEDSMWPCINGVWLRDSDDPDREPSKFMINDGRHEYIASLMLGRTHILVAWVEGEPWGAA